MKLLVIGSSGQLARSLAEYPLAEGDRLVAVGRPDIDLLKPETMKAVIAGTAPDLVINGAAYTAVDEAESNPDLAFAVNAAGAGHVATVCAAARIPLIHISTDYVFDGRKAQPYVEADPVMPINVYGKSKLDGERRVRAEWPNSIVLRSAWIHSPFGKNFVRTMLRLGESRDHISVVTDQIGSPTYAPHLANIILTMAKVILSKNTRDISWGIYHAAGKGGTSWYEFAEEVFNQRAKRCGPTVRLRPVDTAMYPTIAKRPANSVLDGTKLAKQFGITLPDWRIGVADCVARICGG